MERTSPPPEAAVAPLDAELAPALADLGRLARSLGRGAIEADDLLQETAARALRARARLRPGADPRPWLRTILWRVYLDARARVARGPAASLDEGAGARDAEHERAVAAAERLERALRPLSGPEREALLRFHQRHESLLEIAAAMDLPVNTVKSHLHRARLRLARDADELGA